MGTGEAMTADEHTEKAREIAERVGGDETFRHFVTYQIVDALRATEQRIWREAIDYLRAAAEGYAKNHCEHCRDGEIALSNAAFFIEQRLRVDEEAGEPGA